MIIDTIRHDWGKLIGYLEMEKGFEIERIKTIEIKLEKLEISKTIVDTIKKWVTSKKYLYHILRRRRHYDQIRQTIKFYFK